MSSSCSGRMSGRPHPLNLFSRARNQEKSLESNEFQLQTCKNSNNGKKFNIKVNTK